MPDPNSTLRFPWRRRVLWSTFAAETAGVVAVTAVAAGLGPARLPDSAVLWAAPLTVAPVAVVAALALTAGGTVGARLVRLGKGLVAVAALGGAQLLIAVVVDRPGSNLAAVPAGPALAGLACGAGLALLCLPTGYSLYRIEALPATAGRTAVVALPVILVTVVVMVTGVLLGTGADVGSDPLLLVTVLLDPTRDGGAWLWTARLAAGILALPVLVVLIGRNRR